MPDCALVVASRNRRDRVLETLATLLALPERPRVVLVDDASTDGTQEAVAAALPQVQLIRVGRREGPSAGRNRGVRATAEPIVGFCDDDSWFDPGALARADAAFRWHPRLGLIAARILVEPAGRLDPTSAVMARADLGRVPGLGAPRVLGFVACGALVRRSAFARAGGFHPRYGSGGEEQLLAIDMAAAGWELAYLDDVVAHHQPATDGRDGRVQRQLRNDLWTAWLRRSRRGALRQSAELLTGARPATALRGAAAAARGAPWLIGARRPIPRNLEAALDRLR
jgi:GT2 family glycosyltransferase